MISPHGWPYQDLGTRTGYDTGKDNGRPVKIICTVLNFHVNISQDILPDYLQHSSDSIVF